MKPASRILPLLMSLALASGCQSAPKQYVFDRSRTYDQSFDETWDRAIRYLGDHKFPVIDATKETGVVRALSRREDAFDAEPRIADCNTADGPSRYAIVVPLSYTPSRIALNMTLVADGPRTTVTVDTNFKYVEHALLFDGPSRTGPIRVMVQCTSTGVLEQQVLNSL